MKCDKSLAGVPHDAHWHTVRADNIVIAQGPCVGVPQPETPEAARKEQARQAREMADRFQREAELSLEAAAFHRERAMKLEMGG